MQDIHNNGYYNDLSMRHPIQQKHNENRSTTLENEIGQFAIAEEAKKSLKHFEEPQI
jgi:hypothetical protein